MTGLHIGCHILPRKWSCALVSAALLAFTLMPERILAAEQIDTTKNAVTNTAASALANAGGGVPFEVVKDDIDVEINADGSFLESQERIYRPLTAQGIEFLHQFPLSYTDGFQSIDVVAAYTLKKDGTRINVPMNARLTGYGASSLPGFQDLKTMNIVYQNLEVGDEVVLTTVFHQKVPWFQGQFALNLPLSRVIAQQNVKIGVNAPSSGYPIKIDAVGLDGGPESASPTQNRWVWRFHNDKPVIADADSVDEADYGPHLTISSFADYRAVAAAYADRSKGKTNVTPEIKAFADKLTAGVKDRREKAHVLYDWVSSNISYIALYLGADGFTPHAAPDIFKNRYGDCKDHVVLLEALLAAEGIDSTPVLIDIGKSYRLPDVATLSFNHVITYIPEFDLYLDSTAQYASFGTLPFSDGGKPVLRVKSGEVTRTPITPPDKAKILAVAHVTIGDDGSVDGSTQFTGSGPFATELRGFLAALPQASEADYFRKVLGPGAEGSLQRPDGTKLVDTISFGAKYRVPNLISIPGPGAINLGIAYKPFSITNSVAGNLPPSRSNSYVCNSLVEEEHTTIQMPHGASILAMPESADLKSDGVQLTEHFQRLNDSSVEVDTELRIDHPEATCSANYYAQVHDTLAKMVGALRGQILYK
jgi:hypothetical protein